MGLSIHYRLSLQPPSEETSALEARWLVEGARSFAKKLKRRGLVDAVGPLRSDHEARREMRTFLCFPNPERSNSFYEKEVTPHEGWLFCVDIGRDCEPLWLGLCRFPETVWVSGLGDRRTRLAGQWRAARFSKTQYASLHGWEHFQRCHCAIIDLLAALRPVGFTVRIRDEGEYWPRRSLSALRRNLDGMNALVAAAAGALKDASDDGTGKARVESPMFAHPQFERLEAAGEARGYVARLRKLLP